jgi:hypothetical protein
VSVALSAQPVPLGKNIKRIKTMKLKNRDFIGLMEFGSAELEGLIGLAQNRDLV